MAQPKSSDSKDKTSKPTPTQLKAELEALQESANSQKATTRDLLMKIQTMKDVLKNDGKVGATMQQDHYRLQQMVSELRKIAGITDDELYVSN